MASLEVEVVYALPRREASTRVTVPAGATVRDVLEKSGLLPHVEGKVGIFGKTVQADGSRPILDEAEEAGVLMPSGCRMGICYQCVLPMREGSVRDLRTGEITTAVEGDGVKIQTCINAAAGSCSIDH